MWPRKSSLRRSCREAEATFLSMLPLLASTENNGMEGLVQRVKAGIAVTAAEMALRPVASREWLVFFMC